MSLDGPLSSKQLVTRLIHKSTDVVVLLGVLEQISSLVL